jgi:transcriptional regulator
MYLRAIHAETHLTPLLELISQNPLGLLTTAITSTPDFPLIQHTYIPWVLDPPTNLDSLENEHEHVYGSAATKAGPVKQPILGLKGCKLRGHLARANPHAKQLIQATATTSGSECLSNEVTINFRAPQQHYMTPQWYVQTKPETGKVVPTYNYVAVEVRGKARVYHDKSERTSEYLQMQVEDLTREAEGRMGYETTPKDEHVGEDAGANNNANGPAWQVDDAPKAYIEVMKRAIVGIEIEVDSVVGKWKMSQELAIGDREGVKKGLRALDELGSTAVAEVVEARSSRTVG